jgi:large subunit ribosomal protein L15
MKIHELKPPVGAHRSKKRVGRGNAAGQGTTCGRGTKGQLSRAGGRVPAWFEGGQMPLQRRVPKRGFNRTRFKTEVQTVSLADLARFEDETDFTRERLAALGLIDPDGGPVKILARGKLDRVVRVTANAFSAAARDAIEAAGGTAETIGWKK